MLAECRQHAAGDLGMMLQATMAERRMRLSAVRVVTAALRGSDLMRSTAPLLQIRVGANPDRPCFRRGAAEFECRVMRAQARDALLDLRRQRLLAPPGSPTSGHAARRRLRSAKLIAAVDQIAEHVGEILVDVGGETAKVKSVSALSGALAISHQRHRSAGSSSSAASVKTPRPRLVENLPPW